MSVYRYASDDRFVHITPLGIDMNSQQALSSPSRISGSGLNARAIVKLKLLERLSDKTENPISLIREAHEVLAAINPETLPPMVQIPFSSLRNHLEFFAERYTADKLLRTVNAMLDHDRFNQERYFPPSLTERFTDRRTGKTRIVPKVPSKAHPFDSLDRAIRNSSKSDHRELVLIKDLPGELQEIRLIAGQVLEFMNRKTDA